MSQEKWRGRAMLKHTLTIYLIVVLGLLQAACGGGGRSGGSGTASSQDTRIASIKITPGSVMLTQVGEQRALQAQAYNAAGEEVDATFSWSSSHPDQVAIDTNGMLTAQTLGSAEIKATANGVTSESALVLMTLPVANARLVADEQIIGDFTPVDSTAPFGLGFQYTVTLRGVDLPQVGEVLLGTGEAPLGGRVVAATQAGQDVTVTLEIIPLPEMFDQLVLDETIDLNTAPISIPEEVAEYYDVEIKPDGSLQFTLKPDAPDADPDIGQAQSKASPEPQMAAKVTRRIGPFKCEFETSPFLSLNALVPTITIERDLSLPLVYDSRNTTELRKISLKGRMKAEFKVTNTLTAQFESKGNCKREMYRITIPINGFLAQFFGGQIPVGFGFEVGGKVTFAGAGFTLIGVSESTAEVGMSCPVSSSCEMIQTGEVTGQATADWTLPDGLNTDAQLRFEPALYGFAFATLSLGPSYQIGRIARFLMDRLTIDAFELTAGVTLGANLALVEGQMLDSAYASDYKLTQDIKAGPSQTIDSILGMIGVNLVKTEFTSSIILATSPKALVSGVTADVSTFNPGDIVNFKVKLDPTTINFIPGIYNVDEIRIYRKVNTGGVVTDQLVATALADDAQTEFDLSWVATEAGAIGGDFFAFVTTKMLPIELFGTLELEPVDGTVSKLLFINRIEGKRDIYLINADGTSMTNLTNTENDDYLPVWSPKGDKIVFTSYLDGRTSTYVTDTDGTNLVDLTKDGRASNYAIWSSDGEKLVFLDSISAQENGIFIVNADGTSPVEISLAGVGLVGGVSWSADGSKIAYRQYTLDEDFGIFVADINGAETIRVSPDGTTSNRYAWSPDGSKIAMSSGVYGGVFRPDIYVINDDGTSKINVSNNSATADDFVTWSPDGAKMAYISSDDLGVSVAYTVNADGSGKVQVATDVEPPGIWWSPDATRLAYRRDGGSLRSDIIVVNADGSNPVNVTKTVPADELPLRPVWAPDGKTIAFLSNVVVFNSPSSATTIETEVYTVNVDGTNLVNLGSNGRSSNDPIWSRDAKYLAFDVAGMANKINIVRVDDGSAIEIKTANGANGYVSDPAWSP